MFSGFRSFRAGVENLFFYLSVIWRDRSYDETFFLRFMKRKLEKSAKFFKEGAIVEDRNITRMQMLRAIRDINYILEDRAYDWAFREYDEKWEPYLGIFPRPVISEERKYDLNAAFEKYENRKRDVLRRVCNNISSNLFTWWD
jgi:hypothetical protein